MEAAIDAGQVTCRDGEGRDDGVGADAGSVCSVLRGGDVGAAGRRGSGVPDEMAGGANAELARESEMEIPVQVNGKLVTVVQAGGGECG